jgi:hypothetical protein
MLMVSPVALTCKLRGLRGEQREFQLHLCDCDVIVKVKSKMQKYNLK